MKVCKVCDAEYPDDAVHCAADGTALVGSGAFPGSLVGQTVDGRFLVLRQLGEGAMGTVYAATQLSVHREVALKVLRRHLVADEESVRRFLREARAATRLRSPHTVTVHDFGRTDDGLLYLAMELVQGRGLDVLVAREAPLSEARASAIIIQVCEALTEAHGCGIVHRDLKPENIAVGSMGGQRDFVKVLDFGIARFLGPVDGHRVTETGVVVGTPSHMSPEQTRGYALDGRSDIYSLGVILYELLTGELPFVARTTMDLLLAKLEREPPSLLDPARRAARAGGEAPGPLGISEAMDDLVRRMMARDAADRPSNAQAVIAELRHIREASRGAGAALAPSDAATRREPPQALQTEVVTRRAGGLGSPAGLAETEVAPASLAETQVGQAGVATQVAPASVPTQVGPTVAGDGTRWRLLTVLGIGALILAVLLALPRSDGGDATAGGGPGAPVDAARARAQEQPVPPNADEPADEPARAITSPAEPAASEVAAASRAGEGGTADAPGSAAPASAASSPTQPVDVTIVSVPPGATVRDAEGSPLGSTPLVLSATPGAPPRHVVVALDGYVEAPLDVHFDAAHETRVPLQKLAVPDHRERPPRRDPPQRLVNDPSELK